MVCQLEQFRKDIYDWLPRRADSIMDLVDALSSNQNAQSVVELSLSPLFRRQYPSLHDGIDNLFVSASQEDTKEERQKFEQELVHKLVPYLPKPEKRDFWLLGTDVTPAPRPFARTLSDKTYVYQPNVVKGKKPVTIGHQYSALALLPEKGAGDPPWLVPLLLNRVESSQTKREAGLDQIHRLLDDRELPFHQDLVVDVVDSDYSAAPYLGGVARHENLVTVARLSANRTLYHAPSGQPADADRGKGHPIWYGEPMKLKESQTWGNPDDVVTTTLTTSKGRTYKVHLEEWYDMLVRGVRDIPMHEHPFTLIRGVVLDERGEMVFAKALWLIVFGERRRELSLLQSWEAYRQRYDMEHFFRFGKQRLLMGAYQTPETEHEENWWTIVQLAYIQLWIAREQARILPRPWERYLPVSQKESTRIPSPSAVQRDMERIICHFGLQSRIPKPRGKSFGRVDGQCPGRRTPLSVIKKATVTSPQRQRAP